jgi:hypothetical protein
MKLPSLVPIVPAVKKTIGGDQPQSGQIAKAKNVPCRRMRNHQPHQSAF